MNDPASAVEEVVLTDFDGTKTIYAAQVPLPDVVSNGDADVGILVMRHYAKTAHHDEQGRTVYVQRN